MTADDDALAVAAHELYAARPADFVATRKRAAASAATAVAARIARLAKPAVSAAVVNTLVRADAEAVPRLLDMGEQLHAAEESGDAAALRELSGSRRRLVSDLVAVAERAAEEAGLATTTSTRDAVAATLQAAILDPDALRAVASGLLVAPLAPGGDVDGVTALPLDTLPEVARTGPRATRRRSGAGSRGDDQDPGPTAAQLRRARADADRADRESRDAADALSAAQEALDDVRSERDTVHARLDRLRDEVTDLEKEDERLGTDFSRAQRSRRDAAAAARMASRRAAELRRAAGGPGA
jgi:hypothetical protein